MSDEDKDARRVGRDEMNLSEYPVTLLTERVPPGCKTITFGRLPWFRDEGRHLCRSVQYRPMSHDLPTNEPRFGVASRTLIGLTAPLPLNLGAKEQKQHQAGWCFLISSGTEDAHE